MYIKYIPNLGLKIVVLRQKREEGRFRGSAEEAWGRSKEAVGEHGGASREQRGSKGEHYRAVQGHGRREPQVVAAWCPAVVALNRNIRPYCCRYIL